MTEKERKEIHERMIISAMHEMAAYVKKDTEDDAMCYRAISNALCDCFECAVNVVYDMTLVKAHHEKLERHPVALNCIYRYPFSITKEFHNIIYDLETDTTKKLY